MRPGRRQASDGRHGECARSHSRAPGAAGSLAHAGLPPAADASARRRGQPRGARSAPGRGRQATVVERAHPPPARGVARALHGLRPLAPPRRGPDATPPAPPRPPWHTDHAERGAQRGGARRVPRPVSNRGRPVLCARDGGRWRPPLAPRRSGAPSTGSAAPVGSRPRGVQRPAPARGARPAPPSRTRRPRTPSEAPPSAPACRPRPCRGARRQGPWGPAVAPSRGQRLPDVPGRRCRLRGHRRGPRAGRLRPAHTRPAARTPQAPRRGRWAIETTPGPVTQVAGPLCGLSPRPDPYV
jgi:hypothetical protein